MDVAPDQINPAIVRLAQVNPPVKEIVELYLHEVPVNEGKPLTWQDALEMMVVKLGEQYGGALEGWRHASLAASIAKAPPPVLALPGQKPEWIVDLHEALPPDVIEAAIKVGNYAQMQGWNGWGIGPCCDRAYFDDR